MARPSPHPVTTAALTSASPSHLAFILPPLVDRERRRHRDAALVRQRIRVGPESEVHTETPEPQPTTPAELRSEEHTSELQSRLHLVCRLLLEKKKKEEHLSDTRN